MGKSFTLDAVVLSWKRPDNLPAVVESLRSQRVVRRIYIWHNHPSDRKIEGAINIFSGQNFDTFIRHIFGLALDSDYVLFQDDDLVLEGDNSDILEESIRTHGDTAAVMGYSGKKYHRNQKTIVVKGRFHIVKRENLIYPLLFEKKYGFQRDRTIGDDIFLNYAIQHFTGMDSFEIGGLKLRNLSEGSYAKAAQRRWWEKRKAVARKILKAIPKGPVEPL
jgi:hypothetical protein